MSVIKFVNNIPINQPITSPGEEFIYLTSAENENDLDAIRCANQVRFKSSSSKHGWTKLVDLLFLKNRLEFCLRVFLKSLEVLFKVCLFTRFCSTWQM